VTPALAKPVRVLAVGDAFMPAGLFTAALAGGVPDHLVNPEVLTRQEATP
jgi:hypothetical protein